MNFANFVGTQEQFMERESKDAKYLNLLKGVKVDSVGLTVSRESFGDVTPRPWLSQLTFSGVGLHVHKYHVMLFLRVYYWVILGLCEDIIDWSGQITSFTSAVSDWK